MSDLPQALVDNDVVIVAVNVTKPSKWFDTAFASDASELEHERNARFRRPQDQLRDQIVRVLLRQVLAELLCMPAHSINIERDQRGKPRLVCDETNSAETDAVSFNMTHSGEWAVLVVSRYELAGVDIEFLPRNNDVLAIAEHYFHPREVAQLFNLSLIHI